MRVEELSDLLGVPFTPEQQSVITAPINAPLQVVAGAGSGKTTVMAARVVWAVAECSVRPDQVLGLTFTNKAAAGLAAKIRSVLAALGTRDDELEPTVSTYHAYAGRLVREHGLRVGVEPDQRLLVDASRFQLAYRVMRAYTSPLPTFSWVPDTVVTRLIALESACSDHLVDPAALAARERARAVRFDAAAEALAGAKGSKGRRDRLRGVASVARARADLCGLVEAYRAAKRDAGVADFGDQIATAVRIATTSAEAVALERDRFRIVLLDEYQDTSVAQSALLAALFGDGRGVTAVGDPCQAIYGWRGASVANLTAFRARFRQRDGAPAALCSLRTSQRSGGRLLRLANTLSAALRTREDVAELLPRPDRVEVGEVIVARHERYDDERAWVARQVRAEIAAGTPAAEIAVLLRSWKHAAPMHEALTAAGVPVEVVGLGGLLALPEVADVLATLQLVDDPTANAAALRLLTGPRWMLGAADLRALGRVAAGEAGDAAGGPGSEEVDPLDEAAAGVDPADVVALADALERVGRGGPAPGLSDEARERIGAFHRELRFLRAAAGEPLPDLIARVVTTIGLDVEVAASPEAVAARRRAAIAAFADVAADYVDLDGGADLHGFLGYVRAAEDYDRGFDNPLEVSGDAVQILTMHKAKGLEWDVVVLPDLTDASFPAANTDGRWFTNMGELPYSERQDAASLPADPDPDDEDWHAVLTDGCKRHERTEEDRLAYVAVTRARRKVVASTAVWGPTQLKPRAVSPYLLALRDHAAAGHGTVALWTEDPADAKARNPYLSADPVPWPPASDPAALARRLAAADAVRRGPDGPDPIAAGPVADRMRYAEYDREIEVLLAEARAARADVLEVPLPGALSAGQVLRLARDPDGLAAELVRPMPRRPSRAAARGVGFHAWVERQFGLTPLLDDDALTGAADEDLRDEELEELEKHFRASRWADLRPYAVEEGFAVVLFGRVVRGRIDAVYALPPGEPDGARWHVVDWKTGREDADPLQLAVYRAAWASVRGCPVEEVRASFCYLREDRVETPDGQVLTALLAGALPA